MALRSSLLSLLLVAGLSSAAAQAPVVSPHVSLYPDFNIHDFRVAEVDGDGAPDLVLSTIFDGIRAVRGDGLGGILGVQAVAGGVFADLAVADFDGDGLDEVVLVPSSGTGVQVLLDVGGSYVAGPVLATDLRPLVAAVADLDLDGTLDVAVGQADSPRVIAFHGLAGGGFLPGVDVPAVEGPVALALGDVDADGWPDVASASDVFGDRRVGVAPSDGAGGYEPLVEMLADLELFPGDSLVIGDVNGDGIGDVLLALREQGFAVFAGEAGLPPRPPVIFATTLPCQSLSLLDGDDDGDLDVAAGQEGGLVSLYLQQVGGFSAPILYAAAVGPLFLDTADFDLDGNVDLLTSNGQVLTILLGTGLADFRPCYGFEGEPFAMVAGDFTGDGLTDLVVTPADSAAAWVFPGEPGGGLGRRTPVDLGPAPRRLFIGQFDDTLPQDLVALQVAPGQQGVAVVLGQGDGSFSIPVITPILDNVKAGAVGDLNGDHGTDMVVLRGDAFTNEVITLLGAGDGVFTQLPALPLPTRPIDVEIADVDQDLDQDLIVLVDGEILVFPGDDDGTFLDPVSLDVAPGALDLLVAHLNADGDVDLAVAHTADTDVRVYYGDPGSAFAAPEVVDVRVTPTGLAAGDLDADGFQDLVVTGISNPLLPGNVAVLIAEHDGGFELPVFTAASDDAGEPLVADLDLDGRLDLALLVPAGRQLDLYFNAAGVWEGLGHSLAGSVGLSRLVAVGSLQPPSELRLIVQGAAPANTLLLVLGLAELSLPFKGGVLVPKPDALLAGLSTDAQGGLDLAADWPPGVPTGTTLLLQVWLSDAGGPAGLSATTAVRGEVYAQP